MQKDSLLEKHFQEVETEIGLTQNVVISENPVTPVPAPSMPSTGSSYDPQTWNQIIEKRQQRYVEYTQIIGDIKEKYQDPHTADLFESAYAQFDTYLGTYSQLIGLDLEQLKKDIGIFLDFGPKAKICRYPLARKYIITVPQEDADAQPPIWTSMAHELGHFVYWNSEFDNGGIKETAGKIDYILFSNEIVNMLGLTLNDLNCVINPDNSSPITKEQVLAAMLVGWSEEIFADTFGAMIGGMAFAEQAKASFLKDLLNSGNRRFETDRDHPYSLLRPFISATALGKYKKGKNNLWNALKTKIATNAALKKSFQDSLNNMSEPPGMVTDISDENLEVEIKFSGNSFVFSVVEMKQALSGLIQILVEKIPQSKPLPRDTNVWDFIEKFDDPQPPPLIYQVIEGIGYWVRSVWR